MKKILLLVACGLLYVHADAQAVKKQTKTTRTVQKQTTVKGAAASDADRQKQDNAGSWPQLEAFHKVLSQTYHPAEKGNFDPIRKRMTELSKAMGDLIGNPFPEMYQTSEMKVLVANMEDRVAIVNKMVESGAENKELMLSLEQLHDVFHKIAGVCKDTREHND